ncbi:MAG: WhiB family transcriptional regulator [Pseudonocardiaceae bacterium]
MTATDSGWRERAACRDLDTEIFFPVGTTGAAVDQAEQAKAVCARCPVAEACLNWALDANQQDGIWGGKPKTNAAPFDATGGGNGRFSKTQQSSHSAAERPSVSDSKLLG